MPRMKILFWNAHKNPQINKYVVSLILDYGADIVIMAEYSADESELKRLLQENNENFIPCNTVGCNRIQIWSNYDNVKAGIQNKYYSIQVIREQYILCCIHLMSDLYGDKSDERLAKIQEIMHDIFETEKRIHSKKTIIIGDFNEMPYSKGCLSANGFHGLPVLEIEDKDTRKVFEYAYRKFYNPMWNFMGDFSYPPGTYYLDQAKLYSPMWYLLDQVIVSKDMLPYLKKDSLKIITTCSYADLMDEKKRPDKNVSDHFPIICEIEQDERWG